MNLAFSFRDHRSDAPDAALSARLMVFALRLMPTLVGMVLVVVAMLLTTPASAERIKDLGHFQGVRGNQLTGYGIVVGLAGTGDDNLEYTTQGMHSVASRFGMNLPAGVNPALKNAAAVIITAAAFFSAGLTPGGRLMPNRDATLRIPCVV